MNREQDDVIKWKHFPRYWPLWGEFTSHQWCGAFMFSLSCAWTNSWTNNRDASDFGTSLRSLWRHCNEACPCHDIIAVWQTIHREDSPFWTIIAGGGEGGGGGGHFSPPELILLKLCAFHKQRTIITTYMMYIFASPRISTPFTILLKWQFVKILIDKINTSIWYRETWGTNLRCSSDMVPECALGAINGR